MKRVSVLNHAYFCFDKPLLLLSESEWRVSRSNESYEFQYILHQQIFRHKFACVFLGQLNIFSNCATVYRRNIFCCWVIPIPLLYL